MELLRNLTPDCHCVYWSIAFLALCFLVPFTRTFINGHGGPLKGKIDRRVVVVSGASQGIGYALCKLLAVEKQCTVIALARRDSLLQELKRDVDACPGKKGELHTFAVDCSNSTETTRVCDLIRSTFGIPDVLVNNAGAGAWRFLDEVSGSELSDNLSAPPLAALYLCRAFFRDFATSKTGKVIINVQSPVAQSPWPGCTGYAVARYALRGLTEALSADLYGTNAVCIECYLAKTKSQYFENNPGSAERLPKMATWFFPEMTVEEAARNVIIAAEKGKTHVAPWILNFAFMFNGWCPSLVKWLMIVTGYTYKTHLSSSATITADNSRIHTATADSGPAKKRE